MCFSGEMSAGFALIGLCIALWINHVTTNKKLAIGVFFFFLMEALQAVQYIFISSGITDAACDAMINKVLTVLGFLHICLQPYFCHLLNEAICPKPHPKYSAIKNKKYEKYQAQYTVIKRLCLLGGFLLFIRWPLSYVPGWSTMDVSTDIHGIGGSTEWIRGEQLCTFKTSQMIHLGWSVPLADPTYNIMGAGLHAFLMFAPFFAIYEKKAMVMQSIFLYATGPFLASFITNNLKEQASIWCFFSICQITAMMLLIRKTVMKKWGKHLQEKAAAVAAATKQD